MFSSFWWGEIGLEGLSREAFCRTPTEPSLVLYHRSPRAGPSAILRRGRPLCCPRPAAWGAAHAPPPWPAGVSARAPQLRAPSLAAAPIRAGSWPLCPLCAEDMPATPPTHPPASRPGRGEGARCRHVGQSGPVLSPRHPGRTESGGMCPGMCASHTEGRASPRPC